MSLNGQLVFVVIIAIFTLAHGFAACPECVSGEYDCAEIYPKCTSNVDHLCFSNGVYYCAERKPCAECSVPGFTCENKHPFCRKELTTSLCYQGSTMLCVEKIPPTTTPPPPTTTTPKPTTTTTTAAPTTVTKPTTVNPLTKCLTAGLPTGCFLQCPPTWIPFINKKCDVGTCCTFIP